MRIKAISIWEPWASLMALGAKKIETRSWGTRYRGPLLICAALRTYNLDGTIAMKRAEREGFFIGRFEYGKAVAIVDLIRCDVIAPFERDSLEYYLGDFTPGRFAWTTSNLRRIIPFPVRGAQGLFEVDVDLDAVQDWRAP